MGLKLNIITRADQVCQTDAWKRELASAFTRPEDLFSYLGLDQMLLSAVRAAGADFRLLVPRGFARLMERGNLQDPLLRQVLPLGEELQESTGFLCDPVGDRVSLKVPGLLQKYRGRALLIVTGACAVHCRYCFRRHFPYNGATIRKDRATVALDRIAASPDISEVILSGGDPLLLDDRTLLDLLQRLQSIPHVERLRLHTRLPIVLPARITSSLCRLLSGSRLTTVVVVHANHSRELSPEVADALGRLRAEGITLLNQSVLLKGVNDHVQALAELSVALFASGVLPYYLHLLDRVAGAAHFDVSETQAIGLMESLRAHLPGYLVPRLVREEAGRACKTPVI